MGGPSWLVRGALVLAAVTFAYGAYLGVYHAGAEWGWWEGPTDCGAGGAGQATTAEELANQLKNIRIVSCTEASFRFLGLSFAGWNAVVSVVLAVAALLGATRTSGAVASQAAKA
jgi:disulfide bond formation protein DsbB